MPFYERKPRIQKWLANVGRAETISDGCTFIHLLCIVLSFSNYVVIIDFFVLHYCGISTMNELQSKLVKWSFEWVNLGAEFCNCPP